MKKIVVLENVEKFSDQEIIKIILKNRGIDSREKTEEYLNPKLESITIEGLEIDNKELQKSIKRVEAAISKKEKIIIFGDYDVDGITRITVLKKFLETPSSVKGKEKTR